MEKTDIINYKVTPGETLCEECETLAGPVLIKHRNYCVWCAFGLAVRFLRKSA